MTFYKTCTDVREPFLEAQPHISGKCMTFYKTCTNVREPFLEAQPHIFGKCMTFYKTCTNKLSKLYATLYFMNGGRQTSPVFPICSCY